MTVTGASGAVGRHVADRLAAHADVDSLIGLDRISGDRVRRFDLLTDDLRTVLEPGGTIVHLASWPSSGAGDQSAAANDLVMVERIIAAAEEVGSAQLVLASSAMVYGAWPDNPIPLTESAPIRPNPEFRFGAVRAEIEHMGRAWAEATGGIVTILRPCTTMARGRENGLANLLRHSSALRSAEGDAPMQFLHAEDFATAVETVTLGRHGGAFNVAPDGWLAPDAVAALRGTLDTPFRAPAFVISAVSETRRRLGAPTHPGLTPYLMHSWVVGNDRLRALGWAPEFSNEEAYVAGHRPGRLDNITSKRRQEIAMGAAGAAIGGIALGAAAVGSWLWRRRG